MSLAESSCHDSCDHPLRRSQNAVWIDVEDVSRNSENDVISLRSYIESSTLTALTADESSRRLSPPSGEDLQMNFTLVGSDRSLAHGPLDSLSLRRERLGGKDRRLVSVHPQLLVAFRLSSSNIRSYLALILKGMKNTYLLPRFQLDFPFPLLPSLLETIFPTLTSILRHPSLPDGRDFILKHTGNVKKILFGTQTKKDASALRAKIEELGELEIVVEVVVLEL